MFGFFTKRPVQSPRHDARSAAARAATARAAAEAALARASARHDRAAMLRALEALEELDPAQPRWSHKLGELHQRCGAPSQAAAAFQRAASRYAQHGFENRAAAMRRLSRAMGATLGRSVPAQPSLRPDTSPSLQLG